MSIRAFGLIEQSKRGLKQLAPETSLKSEVSQKSIPFAVSQSRNTFSRPQVSTALSRALTLNGAEQPSPIRPRVFQESSILQDQSQLEAVQFARDDNRKARAESTPGLGDRAFGLSNAASSGTEANYPNERLGLEVSSSSSIGSQRDMQQLREVVHEVAYRFVSQQLSEVDEGHRQAWDNHDENNDALVDLEQLHQDDMRAYVDARLGSGVSDIFNLRLEDQGGGVTAIKSNQVQVSELDSDQLATLDAAFGVAQLNYSPVSLSQSLQGADVDQLVSGIKSVLGIAGKYIGGELEAALQSPTDIQSTLNDFESQIASLSLSESDQATAKSYLNQLRSLAAESEASFNANPLSDEMQTNVHTGRYAPAWDPDEIQSNYRLVQDENWISLSELRTRRRY